LAVELRRAGWQWQERNVAWDHKVFWRHASRRQAYSCGTFLAASHFAISILAQNQSDLSARFSKPGSNKWDGVLATTGKSGCPQIDGAIAAFHCERGAYHSAGDHYIIVGRVVDYWYISHAKPLLFYAGAYQLPGFDEKPF
jgi:flavin reductase (DIM6/NTAB) family NADH-FMN oxidoreductase RutF